MDTSPAMSRDGRMVFAATTENPLIFALPLDANAGRTTGPLRRIREDTATTGRSGASEDGRLVVFPRYEFGAGGVWIRDLRTGRERQLACNASHTVESRDLGRRSLGGLHRDQSGYRR